jgi:tryptophanyl-tRNA synthetase
VTDPARVKRTDPGNPDVCNIYSLHKHFSRPETVEHVAVQCRSAGWGCIDCKRELADAIEERFAPMRAKAGELRADPERVHTILAGGSEKARVVAQVTMAEVRDCMGFLLPKGVAAPK